MTQYMYMVKRRPWVRRIEAAWERRPLIWLSGVRRAGKTFLAQSLEKVEYFDCELPRTRKRMEDPEGFLKTLAGKRIVLDEIHRLGNPSELLKIAADHFRGTKILATGSSTLQASAKFRDTLTGRKEEIWLTPMNQDDLRDFGNLDLLHRFARGGLPPFFLSEAAPEREYQEWMDSYWAKDIQELFRLERRSSFQRFLELLLVNSGGIFEATTYAGPCEISRTTVANYLNVLEATRVAQIVRPYSRRSSTEIISAPKVYTLDTGFICYYRGWHELHDTDCGILWEHFVLNELLSRVPLDSIHYWRDKRGHEVDFVLVKGGQPPTAIQCKWKAAHFEPQSLAPFRQRYPQGENWVLASDVDHPWTRSKENLAWEFLGLQEMTRRLEKSGLPIKS